MCVCVLTGTAAGVNQRPTACKAQRELPAQFQRYYYVRACNINSSNSMIIELRAQPLFGGRKILRQAVTAFKIEQQRRACDVCREATMATRCSAPTRNGKWSRSLLTGVLQQRPGQCVPGVQHTVWMTSPTSAVLLACSTDSLRSKPSLVLVGRNALHAGRAREYHMI